MRRTTRQGRLLWGGAATMQEDARLAKASYGGLPVEGYTIDPELSNVNYTTYVKDNKATFVPRGTDLKNWRDIGADALLTLGLQDHSSRFQKSKLAVQRAQQKYGADNVDLAGHSLGGSQALYLSNKLGIKARTFNPGIGPVELFRNRNYSKAENYHAQGDPISFLSKYMRGLRTHITKAGKNPHSISNFS